MFKNLFIAARVFAFVNLLFVPAIAVLLIVAFVSGERWWFGFVGLPALFINAYAVFSRRGRRWAWDRIVAMTGRPIAPTNFNSGRLTKG